MLASKLRLLPYAPTQAAGLFTPTDRDLVRVVQNLRRGHYELTVESCPSMIESASRSTKSALTI